MKIQHFLMGAAFALAGCAMLPSVSAVWDWMRFQPAAESGKTSQMLSASDS